LCEHDGVAAKKGPAMRRTDASVEGFLARVPDEEAMFGNRHQSVLARLGPHKTGKGCLYIKHLDDVDHDALRELIDRSVRIRKGIGRAST
jgi:hypothetical protein